MASLILLSCLENKRMTPFPTIRDKRVAFTYVSVKVYCDCRCPYTGQPMVACSKCKRWFHIECLQDTTLRDVKQTNGTVQIVLLKML